MLNYDSECHIVRYISSALFQQMYTILMCHCVIVPILGVVNDASFVIIVLI